ncbi:MAG: chromosomal replication initiator protein DnaA [Planctomyces sp.]|jgi:chromosomal replication initiator protein
MTLPVRHDDTVRSRRKSRSALQVDSNAAPGRIASGTSETGAERKRNASARPSASQCSAAPLEPSRLENAVRAAVGEQNYQHWFGRSCRLQVSGDRLLIRVPNPFILNWMLKRFRTELSVAAQRLLGPSGVCHFEVDAGLSGVVESATVTESVAVAVEGSGAGNSARAVPERTIADQPALLAVAEVGATARRQVPQKVDSATSDVAGRRRFRDFSSFVAGECNSLAVLAARQICGNPGQKFNPLFIYGSTGTGKTHLLEAIYSQMRADHPKLRTMYLTSEAFTNYFTAALAGRTVASFRQKFRNVDVLIVDNIEFLDNKRATQEEFLHTVVQVIEHGGQVVISSDRHPKMLTKHREELTTRFLSGLVCRMEDPDEETRRRLVHSLSVGCQTVFSAGVVELLVRRGGRGARELQGVVNQLHTFSQLTGRKITESVVRELLGGLQDECRRLIRIGDVEKAVCEVFGVSATDLRSASRRKALAVPRAIAMFLSRKMTKCAYREIGAWFGGRDHSTVVAAEKRVSAIVISGEAPGLPTLTSCRSMSELIDYLERQVSSMAS